jgi:hypothetical protein
MASEWTEEFEGDSEDDEPEFDYSVVPFSVDKDENAKARITIVDKDIDKALEQYDDELVRSVLDWLVIAVVIEDDKYFTFSDFNSRLNSELRRRCKALGLPRKLVNDHVCTVMIRLLASDNEKFRPYAPISQSRYDWPLVKRDKDRFGWLVERLYPREVVEQRSAANDVEA